MIKPDYGKTYCLYHERAGDCPRSVQNARSRTTGRQLATFKRLTALQ